jgi:hypothetical protein
MTKCYLTEKVFIHVKNSAALGQFQKSFQAYRKNLRLAKVGALA